MPAETRPRSSQRGAPPSSKTPSSMPRSSARAPIDLPSILPQLRARLAQEGALTTAVLKALGVPAAQHGDALDLLQLEGHERAGKILRIPLSKQLRRLLEQKQMIPADPAKLRPLLAGDPKPAEIKAAIQGLLAGQGARLIFRGKKKLFLAQPQFRALSAAQMQQLQRKSEALAAFCKEALGQKPPAALFWYDVNELLDDLRKILPAEPAPEAPRKQERPLAEIVLEALRDAPGPSAELASIPTAVARLEASHRRETIHEALLAMDRAGQIELQAEAGLGRFTREELERCPPGPRGFCLVWARLKETKA